MMGYEDIREQHAMKLPICWQNRRLRLHLLDVNYLQHLWWGCNRDFKGLEEQKALTTLEVHK
jgi:hypothetical protein